MLSVQLLNLFIFVFCISTRVSNELGAGQPRNAWLAVIVGGIIAILQGVVVGSTLILGRHVWGKLFSNEKDVVNYVAKMMPFLAISNFIDATQSVLTGIYYSLLNLWSLESCSWNLECFCHLGTARGCGWQKLGVIVNLGAYYVVGIPFSILLAFKFHLKGKVGLSLILFLFYFIW